jgi:hypothetical protein
MMAMGLAAVSLSGCVAEPVPVRERVVVGPGPYWWGPGPMWVPGHFGPYGYWHPGHWR